MYGTHSVPFCIWGGNLLSILRTHRIYRSQASSCQIENVSMEVARVAEKPVVQFSLFRADFHFN